MLGAFIEFKRVDGDLKGFVNGELFANLRPQYHDKSRDRWCITYQPQSGLMVDTAPTITEAKGRVTAAVARARELGIL